MDNSKVVKPFKRERAAWSAMIRRCTDKNQPSFQNYGAQGITVCLSWAENFERFLLDMGPAPSQEHWLGRLDVRRNYEPGNCLWTTRAEQMLRRKVIRKVEWNGGLIPAVVVAKLPGQPSLTTILRRDECKMNCEVPPAKLLSP